jgi:hypothetical protein
MRVGKQNEGFQRTPSIYSVKAFSIMGRMLERGGNKHEKNRELWRQFEKDQCTRSLMFYKCILRSFLIIEDEKERQELNGDLTPEHSNAGLVKDMV